MRVRFLLWAGVLLICGFGLKQIRLDTDVLNVLPKSLPSVAGIQAFQSYFSDARELIITVQGEEADAVEQATRALAENFQQQTNLVSTATWQPVWMSDPLQVSELLAYLWINQPPAAFAGFLQNLSPSNASNRLAEVRRSLATSLSPEEIGMRGYDPFNFMQVLEKLRSNASQEMNENFYSSEDGRFRVIFLKAAYEIKGYRECAAWLDLVKKSAATLSMAGDFPRVKVGYTGRPAFVTEIASGMESDMGGSFLGTMLVIAVLFFLTHARWRPLLCLILFLALAVLVTVSVGGIFYGTISVLSLGFAAILSGLVEDFGIVLYQEAAENPSANAKEVRKHAARGIWGSAIATSGAFFLLNLSGLPGLAQLGTLIGIGILGGALLMLHGFLPMLYSVGTFKRAPKVSVFERINRSLPVSQPSQRTLLIASLILGVTFLFQAIWGGPSVDRSPDPLRPKNSQAYATLDQIKTNLSKTEDPYWIIVTNSNATGIQAALVDVNYWLTTLKAENAISGSMTPTVFWPDLKHQETNRRLLQNAQIDSTNLLQTIQKARFAPSAASLTRAVLEHWTSMAGQTELVWPESPLSRWIFERFAYRAPGQYAALALIYPAPGKPLGTVLENPPPNVQEHGIMISGWKLLGSSVFELVKKEFPLVLIPIVILIAITLWFTFRDPRELLLSFFTLTFSALAFLALMRWLGLQWNLLNLMSIPLIAGMGVDYCIHIQLACRRFHGNRAEVHRTIGRALLLAGSTTIAGFGSLAFSSNSGMASLGKLCALGLSCALLVSIYLLPAWWRTVQPNKLKGVS